MEFLALEHVFLETTGTVETMGWRGELKLSFRASGRGSSDADAEMV